MKRPMDSTMLFAWLFVVFCPLGIAGLLIGQFLVNQAAYARIAELNLIVIYAAVFLAAIFKTVINPRRDKRRGDANCKRYDYLR